MNSIYLIDIRLFTYLFFSQLFEFVCWFFVCLLWEKKFYSVPMLNFKSDCLIFAIELYEFFVFWIVTPY